jgi:hypothetical protein
MNGELARGGRVGTDDREPDFVRAGHFFPVIGPVSEGGAAAVVGGDDQGGGVAVGGHALNGGPEPVQEGVEGGDHVEDAIVAAGVSPVVGLIEGDDEHAGLVPTQIIEREFEGEGVVAGLVPGAEGDVLETAEVGRGSAVLIAGVDENGARGVFGDVMKVVPTGEKSDAVLREREPGFEKFEDGFVGLLDGIVALNNVVGGAAGEDFRIAG